MRSGLAGMRVCRVGTVTDTDTLAQKGSTMLLLILAAIIAALLFGGALLVVQVSHLQKDLRKCKQLFRMAEGQLRRAKRELEFAREDCNRLARELEEAESKAKALDSRLAYALLEERKLKQKVHALSANELMASNERDLLLRIGFFRRKNGRFGKAKGILEGRVIFQNGEGMMDWLLNR